MKFCYNCGGRVSQDAPAPDMCIGCHNAYVMGSFDDDEEDDDTNFRAVVAIIEEEFNFDATAYKKGDKIWRLATALYELRNSPMGSTL